MLALWALFLLSAMVISWALDINSRLTLSGNANRTLEAEAVACSGTEVALHPAVKPGSPNLSGQLGAAKNSYQAVITGEGGRLDVNWLVAGEDPNRLEILRKYLENKGVDLNERNLMVDALLDWISPNTGLHHLNAPAESDDYHPAHAALTRVDELKKVAGWADFTSVPGWDDDFTVNTMLLGCNIDLTWASRDVLLALPGMRPEIVDRFLQLRQGPDGIDGTADDAQFTGIDDPALAAALGLNKDQFDQLKQLNLVSYKQCQVFRVVSVGKAGNETRTIQMVFSRRGGIAYQVITRKEF